MTLPISWVVEIQTNRFLGNYQEHYNVDRDILVYETEPGAGQSYQQLMNYFEAVWALPCCKVFKDSRCESDLAGCYEQTAQRYPGSLYRQFDYSRMGVRHTGGI